MMAPSFFWGGHHYYIYPYKLQPSTTAKHNTLPF